MFIIYCRLIRLYVLSLKVKHMWADRENIRMDFRRRKMNEEIVERKTYIKSFKI